jgi:tetratricopeptide (TPR) repeat protein
MNTMARQITGTLRQKLTSREYNKMNRVPTQNPEAYHEYLLGKQLLLSRQKEKLLAGVRRFDRAIALDSGFADAYAYKASAYFLLASSDFMNMQQGIRLSERNALAAIRLDGENGLAYASLANGYRQLNQWEQAVTTYQIALSHSPNDAQIIYWYSITLRALGRFDDAIRNSNRAVALDPLYPAIIAGHISNYSYAGRYADADRLFNEYALPLSNFYTYYFVKGYHYLNQGNYQDALSELMVSDSLAPAVPITEASVQYCRARLGQRKSAEAYLTSLPENPDTYHLLAIIYAGLEDKENCLKYLRLGAERGTSPFYLKVSPIFRFLHGDPRFDAVLNQLGLLDPRAI